MIACVDCGSGDVATVVPEARCQTHAVEFFTGMLTYVRLGPDSVDPDAVPVPVYVPPPIRRRPVRTGKLAKSPVVPEDRVAYCAGPPDPIMYPDGRLVHYRNTPIPCRQCNADFYPATRLRHQYSCSACRKGHSRQQLTGRCLKEKTGGEPTRIPDRVGPDRIGKVSSAA